MIKLKLIKTAKNKEMAYDVFGFSMAIFYQCTL